MKRIYINSAVVGLLVAMLVFAVYSYQIGLYKDASQFASYIQELGAIAIIVFITIQITSVVVSILPTSIGCVAGVIIFGPVQGFLYNYIGICIGSFIAFGLARHYGPSFVTSIISVKHYERYCKYIGKTNNFEKFFALAIFFPLSPDDILCYMAGLSEMSVKRYFSIITLGKSVSLLGYSVGVMAIISILS